MHEWIDTFHCGNSAEVLQEMPDDSVHHIVTSPPYWDIKDYNNEGQIGYGDELDEYISSLVEVFNECYRVLKPGCRMVVNIGDQYKNSTDEQPYHVVPLNSHFTDALLQDGGNDFYSLGSIIWHKQSNTSTSGGASVMGSFGRPRNGYVSYSHEYIDIFKKPGKPPGKPEDMAEEDEIPTEEWKKLFSDHWAFKGARQDEHPAPFPVELPERTIRMFTFEDDVVLDPFMGSGSTAIAAERMHRNWIGIDINEEYVEKAYERVSSETKKVFTDRSIFDY